MIFSQPLASPGTFDTTLDHDPLLTRINHASRATVDAVTYWDDPKKLAEVSSGLGRAMPGLEIGQLAETEKFAARGW